MLALGNDIVDLRDEPKNGKRYFQRLLRYSISKEERIHLAKLAHLGERLASALIWAIKESGYKSSIKLGNRERFNPKKIIIFSLVLDEEHVSGCVLYEQNELIIEGKINDCFVHVWTSHSREKIKLIEALSFGDGRTQSLEARNLALESLGEEDAIVEKDSNLIPWIMRPLRGNFELSISHHGKYIACAHQT